MKLTWNKNKNNKKRSLEAIANYSNLPFDQQKPSADDTQLQNEESPASQNQEKPSADALDSDFKQLAQSFQAQGNKLAEDGKYCEALGKWEMALNLTPANAVLLEQKAQVLLEIGDAWTALKAATRATELAPSWAEVCKSCNLTAMLNIKLYCLPLKTSHPLYIFVP
ncbi:hypothetical protein CRYUN_Cryun28dG0034500 [Craigia yunnanensis]